MQFLEEPTTQLEPTSTRIGYKRPWILEIRGLSLSLSPEMLGMLQLVRRKWGRLVVALSFNATPRNVGKLGTKKILSFPPLFS